MEFADRPIGQHACRYNGLVATYDEALRGGSIRFVNVRVVSEQEYARELSQIPGMSSARIALEIQNLPRAPRGFTAVAA